MKTISLSKLMAAFAVLLALAGFSLPAAAVDTLYLVDAPGTLGVSSKLYIVALAGANATCTLQKDLVGGGTRKWDRVLSLAWDKTIPDFMYYIDNQKPAGDTVGGIALGIGYFAWYKFSNNSRNENNAAVKTGSPLHILPQVCGGSVHPTNGKFYVITQKTQTYPNDEKSLFTVAVTTPWAATLVGKIKLGINPATIINVNAGGLAFDPTNNDLYLWTNLANGRQANKGLYKLTLPVGGTGDVYAQYIGQPASIDWSPVTGMAIGGTGTMYVATAKDLDSVAQIVVVDKSTGAFGTKYNMKTTAGAEFVHYYGSLAVKY